MTVGIVSYGAWLPRLRLQRQAMVDANAWFNPALKAQGKGECAMANWDEDAVTMAVEAARDCLTAVERDGVQQLFLGSTSLPFDERQNSALVVEALGLPEGVAAMDVTSSLRAGISALALALRSSDGATLVVASDRRDTRVGSPQEMSYGDGAAALLVGSERPIAVPLGSAVETLDFTDHYRGRGVAYDYGWEERWLRDEGHMKLVPRVVTRLLEQAGVAAGEVAHLCLAGMPPRTAAAIAKRCGFAETALGDPLLLGCGDTGAAHPLLLLAAALERAKPGERLLVAGFGQGCEALLLQATEEIEALPRRRGVAGSLARRRAESTYAKRLAFRDQVPLERGMRAELDKATALSAHWRHRQMLLGFVGGRCTTCGTLQFPKSRICVNPNCEAMHTQEDVSFAEMEGQIMTYTADRLTYCPDPPQHYGMVTFEQGGRVMLDFTDVDQGDVEVGMPMRMVFRIKDYDPQRGFTRYFWKATPAATFAGEQ